MRVNEIGGGGRRFIHFSEGSARRENRAESPDLQRWECSDGEMNEKDSRTISLRETMAIQKKLDKLISILSAVPLLSGAVFLRPQAGPVNLVACGSTTSRPASRLR
jgi:hypothetical protein